MKVWDAVAPNITDLPPALSSTLRVGGPISAALWCAAEIAGLAALSLLRVPGLSPSKKKLPVVVPLLLAWNVFCWFLADVSGVCWRDVRCFECADFSRRHSYPESACLVS